MLSPIGIIIFMLFSHDGIYLSKSFLGRYIQTKNASCHVNSRLFSTDFPSTLTKQCMTQLDKCINASDISTQHSATFYNLLSEFPPPNVCINYTTRFPNRIFIMELLPQE